MNIFIQRLAAAINGEAAAQYDVAAMYLVGLPIQANARLSVYWFQKAALQEHPGALYILGALYYFGDAGVVQDKTTALKLVTRAAQLGSAEGQYFMYCNCTDKDQRAIEWLKKAAKNGHKEAQFLLGQTGNSK